MDQQIQGSNLRLVRNVIGCSEENVETAPSATIGELLQLLAAKPCDRIQQNVFRRCNDRCSTAQVCLNHSNPARVVTCRILGDLNDLHSNDLNIEINNSGATPEIRRDLVHGIRGQLDKR